MRSSVLIAVSGCVAAIAAMVIVGCAAPAPTGSDNTSSVAASPALGAAPTGSSGASSRVTSATGPPVSPSTPSGTALSSGTVPPALDTRPPRPTSPTLFLGDNGDLAEQPPAPSMLTLHGADGQTRDGDPYQPVVFTATDLWLDNPDGATSFDIPVDAGTTIGSGTQLRMSVDLTGDGTWDRVETFRYFATDPLPGPEPYTQDVGISSSTGAWGDLRGGTVRLEIWSTLGDTGSAIALGDTSVLQLPFP